MKSYLPASQKHLDLLRQTLSLLSPIDDEAWAALSPHWKVLYLESGDFLLEVGDEAKYVAFVFDGVLREYFLNEEGHEYNKAFIFSHDITGSLYDFLHGQTSTASIQAIKKSELVIFPYELLREMYDQYACLQRLGRLINEWLFMKKAQREQELLTMNATSRFLALQDQYPRLEQDIAQYHIASFLGITPVALSRLKRNIAKSQHEQSVTENH